MPLDPTRVRLLWKAQPHSGHGMCHACGEDSHRYGTRRSCMTCLSCFAIKAEHEEKRAARRFKRAQRALVSA